MPSLSSSRRIQPRAAQKRYYFPFFLCKYEMLSAFPHRAQERCRWLLLAREADSEATALRRQCSPGGSQGQGSAPHAWEGVLGPCRGPTCATPGTAYLLWACLPSVKWGE